MADKTDKLQVDRYSFSPDTVRVGYDPHHYARVILESNTSANTVRLEVESNPYGYEVPSVGEHITSFWAQPAYGGPGEYAGFHIPTSYLPVLFRKLSSIMPLADGDWRAAIDGLTVWEQNED